MITLTAKTLIQRPASEVFSFIGNYQNDWKWRSQYLEVESLNQNIKVEFKSTRNLLPLLPPKQHGQYQILIQEPYRRLVSKIKLGKMSLTDERLIKDHPGHSTEFQYSLHIELNGLTKLLQLVLIKDLSRYFHRDLQWLKELLEVLPTSDITPSKRQV